MSAAGDTTALRRRFRSRTSSNLEVKRRSPPEDSDEEVGVIHVTPSVVDGCVQFETATYPAFYKLTPDGKLDWKYEIAVVLRSSAYVQAAAL